MKDIDLIIRNSK